MDIYNTSIHVVIGKYTVRHICHVFYLTESVQCDLAVDAFVAFRCAVQMCIRDRITDYSARFFGLCEDCLKETEGNSDSSK